MNIIKLSKIIIGIASLIMGGVLVFFAVRGMMGN
jgi:hypothetical protein